MVSHSSTIELWMNGLPTICQGSQQRLDRPPGCRSAGASSGAQRGLGAELRVEKGTASQHGNKDLEPSVGHDAQRTAVAFAAGAQLGIVLSASGIVGDAFLRPVIESITQAQVTTIAHGNNFLLAALAGDGRSSTEAAQSVIISLCDGLRGLAEHRGGDLSSQPGQGEEDGGVTMLLWILLRRRSQFVEHGLDAAGQIDALLMEQAQTRQQ